MESAARPLPIKEPTFLRENWKRVLAETHSDSYRYVRVLNNVATVTNGEVLIRCPVGLSDGFYVLGPNSDLKSIESLGLSPKKAYPDVESCRPNFERMTPSGKLPNQVVGQLIVWLEFVRAEQSNVVVTKNGFAMNLYASRVEYPLPGPNAPEYNHSQMAFDFRRVLGFEIPIFGEGAMFSPKNLKLAFTEMLRYDFCYLSRHEGELSSKGAPLVIGHDWGHCALVAPIDSWR
jgi:hypothetical protein